MGACGSINAGIRKISSSRNVGDSEIDDYVHMHNEHFTRPTRPTLFLPPRSATNSPKRNRKSILMALGGNTSAVEATKMATPPGFRRRCFSSVTYNDALQMVSPTRKQKSKKYDTGGIRESTTSSSAMFDFGRMKKAIWVVDSMVAQNEMEFMRAVLTGKRKSTDPAKTHIGIQDNLSLVDPAELRLMQHKRGVSIAALRYFIKHHTISPTNITREVVKESIVPETAEAKNAYVRLLISKRDASNTRFVGTTSHFVSHAWGYNFHDLVQCLEDVQKETDKTLYFWLDIFAINQHCTSDENELPALAYPIFTSKSCLVMMDRWPNPLALTRVWCLFEIYKAYAYGASVRFVMLRRVQRLLAETFATGAKEVFLQDISRFSILNAEATHEADKRHIFKTIQVDMGHRHDVENICKHLGLTVSSSDLKAVPTNAGGVPDPDALVAQKKQPWLDQRPDNFFLKCSVEGEFNKLLLSWNHESHQVVEVVSGKVLYDMNEGLAVMDGFIVNALKGFMVSVNAMVERKSRSDQKRRVTQH